MNTIIGAVVGILFVVGYIPQLLNLIKAKKKSDLEGVSVTFWIALYVALTLTLNNFQTTSASVHVVIPQLLNSLFAWIILAFVIYRKTKRPVVNILTVFLGMMYLISVLPIWATQNVATALIFFAYLSQIYKIWRTKNVDGLSLPLFILIAIALSLMITNIWLTGAYWLANWTELTNLILIVAILIQIVYYRIIERGGKVA